MAVSRKHANNKIKSKDAPPRERILPLGEAPFRIAKIRIIFNIRTRNTRDVILYRKIQLLEIHEKNEKEHRGQPHQSKHRPDNICCIL